MDNKHIEVIVSYGIYCLNRQEQLLDTCRKLRRAYIDLTFIIVCMVIGFAGILASISFAVTGYLDGWVPVLLTVTIGAFIALLVMALKAILGNIDAYKRFIAESRDINNTLADIADVLNLLEDKDTQEDTQC